MKITYEKIKLFRPCSDGWKKLLENTNPEMDMTKEIDLIDILRSNGIKDAVWALRCWDYFDYCLFLADVAESVLPIFEKKYPNDDRPRKALQSIRGYRAGKITRQEIIIAATAADDAAYAAYADAAYADAAYAAAAAAADAAYAAYATAYAAAAAADAAYAAYAAAYAAAAAADAARQKKWDEIEQIFIKHFGG